MDNIVDNVTALHVASEDVTEEKKETLVTIDYKMVTFSLSGKDYAIDIMKVKEIAKAGRFTFVPNTAPFVLGVYNLRGEIIPIVDLRLFFNIDIPERQNDDLENMIIVNVGEQIFGVVVDSIDKVVGINSETIQPPHPLFGDINIKYIYGVVESADRLYIILDIDKIFGVRTSSSESQPEAKLELVKSQQPLAEKNEVVPSVQDVPVEVKKVVEEKNQIDYTFIVDSLQRYKNFHVSTVNESWVSSRFSSWLKDRGEENSQLKHERDADLFLKDFYSPCTGRIWSKEYAEAFYNSLPDNTAKQINIWNPGCGKGYETYSIACLVKRRYPNARIRIFANDIDLLSVSNAPLLAVSQDMIAPWIEPFLTKAVNGSYSFNQDIKDMIMFEYHDCVNANSVPNVDIIVCRDVISFLKKESQELLLADFDEKLKGNGVLFLGSNELLTFNSRWSEEMHGNLPVYKKI